MVALLTVTMIALMCAHVLRDRRLGLPTTVGQPAVEYRRVRFRLRELYRARLRHPVPPEGKRLIGPITALNGLLLIGWSVAIIFEVMRMARVQIGRLDERDEASRPICVWRDNY